MWAVLSTSIPPSERTSLWSALLLLKIASTLAVRILGLNGLDIYSSTPSSKPNNSSCSSPLAVSMTIGTLDSLRISRHTCQPSILGIITSSIIRSIVLSLQNISIACSPFSASTTSYPFLVRKSRTSLRILLSSSTTSILFPI